MRVVRLCRRMSWDVPLSHGALGSRGTSHQSQVWNMLSPSCPSRPIVPCYLGIPRDIPAVPLLALALALTLSLAQTRDWWDVPWDPKVPWNYGTGWTRGTKYCMYPRPGTGGMSHGIPRHYGTMACPEVLVDILRQSWTIMPKAVEKLNGIQYYHYCTYKDIQQSCSHLQGSAERDEFSREREKLLGGGGESPSAPPPPPHKPYLPLHYMWPCGCLIPQPTPSPDLPFLT